mmetsp:Transcript_77583/g.157543  ORF Transcript_77583/g.157543 Transcript_77583/m.157543 type:complete len:359 (-) Transcript_77583:330-1406(-)
MELRVIGTVIEKSLSNRNPRFGRTIGFVAIRTNSSTTATETSFFSPVAPCAETSGSVWENGNRSGTSIATENATILSRHGLFSVPVAAARFLASRPCRPSVRRGFVISNELSGVLCRLVCLDRSLLPRRHRSFAEPRSWIPGAAARRFFRRRRLHRRGSRRRSSSLVGSAWFPFRASPSRCSGFETRTASVRIGPFCRPSRPGRDPCRHGGPSSRWIPATMTTTTTTTSDCCRKKTISTSDCRRKTTSTNGCYTTTTTTKKNKKIPISRTPTGCSCCHCCCRSDTCFSSSFSIDRGISSASFSLLFGVLFPCVSCLAPPFSGLFPSLFGPFLSFPFGGDAFLPGVLCQRPHLLRACPC